MEEGQIFLPCGRQLVGHTGLPATCHRQEAFPHIPRDGRRLGPIVTPTLITRTWGGRNLICRPTDGYTHLPLPGLPRHCSHLCWRTLVWELHLPPHPRCYRPALPDFLPYSIPPPTLPHTPFPSSPQWETGAFFLSLGGVGPALPVDCLPCQCEPLPPSWNGTGPLLRLPPSHPIPLARDWDRTGTGQFPGRVGSCVWWALLFPDLPPSPTLPHGACPLFPSPFPCLLRAPSGRCPHPHPLPACPCEACHLENTVVGFPRNRHPLTRETGTLPPATRKAGTWAGTWRPSGG